MGLAGECQPTIGGLRSTRNHRGVSGAPIARSYSGEHSSPSVGQPQSLRCGFTLIELLVVIAIIGVLVGLLLPAVQQARAAARRTACTSKLKQMITATMNFESARGELPRGAIRWTGGGGYSWHYYILPFIEELEMFDDGAVQSGETDDAADRGTRLLDKGGPYLRCPSDPWKKRQSTTNYFASCGPMWIGGGAHSSCTVPFNAQYANRPDLGYSESREQRGYVPNRSRMRGMFHTMWSSEIDLLSFRLRDATDGLSNTIALGESLYEECAYGNDNAFTRWQNHPITTVVPINTYCEPSSTWSDCATNIYVRHNWGVSCGFKSRHDSGANFAFGDGTVRFLNDTINMDTFQLLGHPGDGQPSRSL